MIAFFIDQSVMLKKNPEMLKTKTFAPVPPKSLFLFIDKSSAF
jgi:hypothetical protein